MMGKPNWHGSRILAAAALLAVCGVPLDSAHAEANETDSDYEHAKYAPTATDIVRDFEAFTVSFDSKDDDDGDGEADLRRTPEWVAQEIRRFEGPCVETRKRPSRWRSDRALYTSGVAPRDESYAGSGFDRGHMAAKLLAARISLQADRETHTVLNAVPQSRRFNQQIWRSLEDYTGAWAQVYGKVWVVQGPVFYAETNPENARWIGDAEEGERLVAVPDALFKIVVREDDSEAGTDVGKEAPGAGVDVGEGDSAAGIEVLAFVYPQVGARYFGKWDDFAHERFLTTIQEVETMTGLGFAKLASARTRRATGLWPAGEENFITGCVKD